MTPADIQSAARSALAHLLQIATQCGVAPDARPSPAATVRPFAEALILCPDAQSATRLIQSAPAAARAFLTTASYCLAAAARGTARVEVQQTGGPVTPYFHLCSAVLDFLTQLQQRAAQTGRRC